MSSLSPFCPQDVPKIICLFTYSHAPFKVLCPPALRRTPGGESRSIAEEITRAVLHNKKASCHHTLTITTPPIRFFRITAAKQKGLRVYGRISYIGSPLSIALNFPVAAFDNLFGLAVSFMVHI